MSEELQIALIFSVYGGLISYVVTGIVLDKIKDTKQKKRFRENQEKIKDGTFVGAPYYSGASVLTMTPLSLSKLQKSQ